MKLTLSPDNIADYQTFLKVKSLPRYRVVGRTVEFPDEYAKLLNKTAPAVRSVIQVTNAGRFDYQIDITALAIRKQKFAVFVEPGYGKTLIMLDWVQHVAAQLLPGRCILIVSPLMVVRQTLEEAKRFYGDSLPIERVTAKNLASWLASGESRIGITNYDALNESIPQGRLGALALDESSMLKSAYGKWGTTCIRLGKGLAWKLALTGTPAPNDRIEFANHAVFLDQFPTVNSFLVRFFVNRGQTNNRWALKPHALMPFYRALSHWSIFMSSPATYGWKDNAGKIPPIEVHIHDVPMTPQQQGLAFENTGRLFADQPGGITSRSVLSQIAKGNHKGVDVPTNKPAFIRSLVESWPEESTIIWCLYNREQELLEESLPNAISLTGATPEWKRDEMVQAFQRGERRVLISKPKILGLGLNLQVATRQIFSGLQDSYESFWQGVKRSNRVGSTRPLNVHIPVTEIEKPMIETVISKAKRVQRDAEEQEQIFKQAGMELMNA